MNGSISDKESRSDPQPKFTQLNNLASEKVGSHIVFATDDWFAVAENLLKAEPAEWKEGVFSPYGKWMDGWETRRKRIPGHDWCIIQLGAPGVVSGFDVDTSYFTGNYTPRVSIQACELTSPLSPRTGVMGTAASMDDMKEIANLKSQDWDEILPMTPLKPGYKDTAHNYFQATQKRRWTHLRLNMFPDGGIARLRVYGEVVPDWTNVSKDQVLDLVSMMNGGVCTGFSDSHYGTPQNLIRPDRAENMGDGWETARKISRPAILVADQSGVLKVPGTDWAEFKLGHPGHITKIEIDTQHFKGNFPDSCRVEALITGTREWTTLLPAQKMFADRMHVYEGATLTPLSSVSHVRLVIAPDGGVARFRVWGCTS